MVGVIDLSFFGNVGVEKLKLALISGKISGRLIAITVKRLSIKHNGNYVSYLDLSILLFKYSD